MEKNYQEIEFDETRGFPIGDKLHYQCSLCDGIVYSLVKNAGHCECRNLRIDSDAGRVCARQPGSIKLLEHS